MKEIETEMKEYFDSFDNMSLKDKKIELAKKINEMSRDLSELSQLVGKSQTVVIPTEFDSNIEDYNDSSYFTKMFVNINILDQQIGELINKLVQDN